MGDVTTTCDRCLNGDPWRCRGRGKCANFETARSYGRRTGRSSSRKEGVGSPRFQSPYAIDGGPKKVSEGREKTPHPRPVKSEGPRRIYESKPNEISAPPHLVVAITEMGEAGMSPGLISRHLEGEQAPSLRTIENLLAMSPSME